MDQTNSTQSPGSFTIRVVKNVTSQPLFPQTRPEASQAVLNDEMTGQKGREQRPATTTASTRMTHVDKRTLFGHIVQAA